MQINPQELITASVDDQGRIQLGEEYANRRVTVVVVEDEPTTRTDDLAAAYRDAADSAASLTGARSEPTAVG